MRRKLLPLIAILLLVAALAGGSGWMVYAPIRQEQLNRALIAAIKKYDARKALALLAEGADPNARDTPPTPFSFRRALQMLLHRPAASTDSTHSPMALTLAMGVELEAEDYGTSLFCCKDDRDGESVVKIVKALCAHGADVNRRGPGGYTPLMTSTYAPESYTLARMLLDRGAQVNARGADGQTSLMLAASGSDPRTIALLLDKGADVNAQDQEGNTALMEAAEVQGNGRPLANLRLLIARHARINVRNKEGDSALTLAERTAKQDKTARSVVKLLKQAGARP